MTIKKSVDHLVFKLSNVWKATPKDAEAINTIMKFVEDKHRKQIQDYHLFSKLYIMVYAKFLDKYKATVFDDIPRKELTKYLDQPIEYIIKRFTERLNESELYTVFDLAGKKDFDHIHLTHIKSFYKEMGYNDGVVKQKVKKIIDDRKKSRDSLEVLLDSHQDVKNYLFKGKEIWDYNTVKDNLELQINNTINLLS